MKHIGWCLDKIQRVMAKIPKAVDTPDDKKKANDILDDVEGYANTLEKIITNPKFKKYIHRLEKAPIEEARLEAHEIEELIKDLEHMLQVLDTYLKNLRDIVVNHPDQWYDKSSQLSLMIDQKFGDERGELRKEFQAVVHTEEELREVVTSDKHLEAFLK